MTKQLTLGSLFDGVGMWLLSAERNGIRPVWASEVEPFPISVTKKHFPYVEHLGDVTKIKGDEVEPVDIITAGSPCQDLSVAGKRKGLDGERSGLFVEAIRLVREMQEATNREYPKAFCWENVVGCLSSNHGHDFRAVLEYICQTSIPMPEGGRWADNGMVESSTCTAVWSILDASVFGVPQRRRRIFLVADFRAIKDRKPQVFFEPEGLSGDSKKSKGQRKDSARDAQECFGITGNTIDRQSGNGGNGDGFKHEQSYTLTTMDRHAVAVRERAGCAGGGKGLLYSVDKSLTLQTTNDQMIYSMAHACDVIRESEGVAPTLTHRMGTGGNNVPLFYESHPMDSRIKEVDVAPTLTRNIHKVGVEYGLVQDVQCFEPGSIARDAGPSGLQDVCSTLRASMGDNQPAVVFGASSFGTYTEHPAPLKASGGDMGGGSENLVVSEV